MTMQQQEQSEKQKWNVELYGQKYTFRASNEEQQKLLKVAAHVDAMMQKIGASQPKLEYRDIAVLAAMHIAEEYDQLEQDYQALIAIIDEEK